MIELTLKDGRVISVEAGSTCREVAEGISQGLARNAMAAEVDGQVVDLSTPLTQNANLNILTFQDEGGRLAYRHTGSHVLAQAVLRLFPETKLAIGPAIKDGFYYDFDSETTFTPEILEKIEAEMKRIVAEDLLVERFTLPREEALAFVAKDPYKVELVEELPANEAISFYRQGEFTDLCAGPHLARTGELKAAGLCLQNCTGAYWRGDSKNKMLQRVYGTCFPKKAELDEYLERLEEAKKRDHRKLGRELGLFLLRDEGPGFPIWLDHGMTIKNLLIDYWRNIHQKAGYQEINTPIMLSRELWERSGHWGHYSKNMYSSQIDDMDFAIKPMNCPGCILVYESEPRSYRDLPFRIGELGLVHRHELSGALHGLMRVRCFTQDDAHIFMTSDQIKDEIIGVLHLVDEIYKPFGFKYRIELSTMPENHIGEVATWDKSIAALKAALDSLGRDYVINEGDGAFYGPKIDFHLEDSIGRTWQCGTIQLDMNLPERFDLEYIGPDGEKHKPVMIHRAIFGSIERFIGILIEHFAGAFPTWLAPVQVRVMPITDRAREAGEAVAKQLEAVGVRVETDFRNEKIGFKIREAQVQKIPYMLVLGDREAENGEVSVRTRAGGDQGSMPVAQFLAQIQEEISAKS